MIIHGQYIKHFIAYIKTYINVNVIDINVNYIVMNGLNFYSREY